MLNKSWLLIQSFAKTYIPWTVYKNSVLFFRILQNPNNLISLDWINNSWNWKRAYLSRLISSLTHTWSLFSESCSAKLIWVICGSLQPVSGQIGQRRNRFFKRKKKLLGTVPNFISFKCQINVIYYSYDFGTLFGIFDTCKYFMSLFRDN